MKKFILTFVFVMFSVIGFAQTGFNRPFFRIPVDFNKYEIVDSLPIERIMIHFNKEIDNEDFIDLGDGDYMAPVPHKDNMVIRMNATKDKAVVIHNSYAFGRHFEFDVQDNDKRIVLYYQDKNIYCGYIYDKEFKVCKYFESKKEFNKLIRHRFFDPNFRMNIRRYQNYNK